MSKTATTRDAQPLVRWAGSKRKLLPILSRLVPEHFERYVEPFAGSACLFFYLRPRRAILGDINQELINVYMQVKWRPHEVASVLETYSDRSPAMYYAVRAQNTSSASQVELAARFIFLNRLCFNGLYRTNTQGRFNVPFGGEKSGALPTKTNLDAVSQALRHTRLVPKSFESTLMQVQRDDFVYLDPPYSISNRRVFNNYATDIFSSENLKQLRLYLERLDGIGCRFLLSYGLSREGLALAKGFRARQALVQRQISGFSAHRRKAREILVTNY